MEHVEKKAVVQKTRVTVESSVWGIMTDYMDQVIQLCAARGVYIVENWEKRRWELVDALDILGWCSFSVGVDMFVYWVTDKFCR